MPIAVASPVPRCSVCSTNVTLAQAGAVSWTFLVTCSAPWPTTTAVRSGASSSRAWMTWSTIGRPQIWWSGLGRSERIRVPAPAARTITETLIAVTSSPGTVQRAHCLSSWFRGEDSNPYKRHQKPLSYH